MQHRGSQKAQISKKVQPGKSDAGILKKPGVTKYCRERCILTFRNDITRNWKRGLWAVGIFVAVWIGVIFIAFMTALGNATPLARTILRGVELFAVIANPLWGIPIAFLIGIYSKRK